MGISRSLAISASGLTAERVRMDVISNNLANINSTITDEGTPYRRQHVIFSSAVDTGDSFAAQLQSFRHGEASGGVIVSRIEKDKGDFKRVRDPDSPTGYTLLPNIEPVMEMVDLITATRAFDAGVTAMGAAKQMQDKALEIGRS